MIAFKSSLLIACTSLLMASCTSRSAENTGSSTPIDSTNVKGTAPVTYGGNNPANDRDTSRANANDTGTKANNVHNTGYDSAQQKNKKK